MSNISLYDLVHQESMLYHYTLFNLVYPVISIFWFITVADLRGMRGTRPQGVQILSISCRYLGKFSKIVCWRPLEGWRPHLREILDPPLHYYVIYEISAEFWYLDGKGSTNNA